MISFSIQGHPCILAEHATTFAFTKDKEISEQGDCYIGVKADFDAAMLREFNQEQTGILIRISVDGITEEIQAATHKGFNDDRDIVVRTSHFLSERTYAIKADKAAKDLKRDLIQKLRQGKSAKVIILANEKILEE